MMNRMSFFGSEQEAVDYAMTQLFDALQEKYVLMTENKYESRHYNDCDRAEMRLRISDLRKCEPVMRSAVHLHEMSSILRKIEKWQKSKTSSISASQLLMELKPRIRTIVSVVGKRKGTKRLLTPHNAS